jgi:hypothetical protein
VATNPGFRRKNNQVTIPEGTKMQASVGNNILQWPHGGGGVQFQITVSTGGEIPGTWFSNRRELP